MESRNEKVIRRMILDEYTIAHRGDKYTPFL